MLPMRLVRRLVCCVFLSTSLASSPSAAAPAARPSATYERIVLPGLGGESAALAIDEHGRIVGTSGGHLVQWVEEEVRHLAGPGHYSDLIVINDRDQILTLGWDTGSKLWTSGVAENLPFEGRWINKHGVVVGNGNDGTYNLEGRLWKNGTVERLTSIGLSSYAMKINDHGDIIGGASFPPGGCDAGDVGEFYPPEHAVLWRDGTVRDLGLLPGTTQSAALDINNQGAVVGWCENLCVSGLPRACMWKDGVITDLGSGVARAINDRGDIVLERVTKSSTGSIDSYWAVWRDGIESSLPMYPAAMNNRGQIVGTCNVDPGTAALPSACFWEDGIVTPLGNGHGNDINDRGEAVGYSQGEAVLWKPARPAVLSASAAARGLADRLSILVSSRVGSQPATFRLAGATGTSSVKLFDIQGRMLRRWDGLGSGGQAVHWDETGRDGSQVAAGLYFLRATNGDRTVTAKILVAR